MLDCCQNVIKYAVGNRESFSSDLEILQGESFTSCNLLLLMNIFARDKSAGFCLNFFPNFRCICFSQFLYAWRNV